MIILDDTLLSDELFDISFACDLNACKGACCIEGDLGAPLELDELPVLEEIYDEVSAYMTPEGIKAVKEIGTHDIDPAGNPVTPLVENKQCAFVFFDEKGIAKCAIEKAWLDKKIDFQKPVSCHLYPVRISRYAKFDAVNYHCWQICDQALVNGKKLGIPLFRFLKDPLIRAYGEEYFEGLEAYYAQYNKTQNK